MKVNNFCIVVLHYMENRVKVIFDDGNSFWESTFPNKTGLITAGEKGVKREISKWG